MGLLGGNLESEVHGRGDMGLKVIGLTVLAET